MPSSPLRKVLKARGLYPHQVEFVEEVLGLGAGARVLLADAVGLGKRVACAALIGAYEAKIGGNGAYLIVAPSTRVKRWVEYVEWYAAVSSAAVDAPMYRSLQIMEDGRPWNAWPCAVTSLDFAKEPTRMRELCEAPWDMVVVDEAHLCTPHSQRGRLFEGLWGSARANVVVAVTAAPIENRRDESIAVRDKRTTVIRRPAAELRDWKGRPLFGGPERRSEEIPVTWSISEQAFMHRVLEVARRLLSDPAPRHQVLASQLVRRLGSSLGAIEATLRRRMVALRDWELDGVPSDDEADVEASCHEEAEGHGSPEAFAEQTCKALLELVEQIDEDSKWKACRALIQRLRHNDIKRIVIFAEYADTAVYVGSLCDDAGWAAEVVTSRMSVGQREAALAKCMAERSVLVLTSEVAEGLALSSFRHAVHYDLPWDAAILFQRLGRLERLSGPRDAARHYFLVDDVTTRPVLISKLLALKNIGIEDALLLTGNELSNRGSAGRE